MKYKTITNYFQELLLTIKEHYILIISFIMASSLVKLVSIPFVSILLILILLVYLSRTREYRAINFSNKIIQFILFFIISIFLLVIIEIPAVLYLLSSNNIVNIEDIVNSELINIFLKIGILILSLFIFAPYRIFDTGDNIIKSIIHSYSIVIKYVDLFLCLLIFCYIISYITRGIEYLDDEVYIIYLLLTISLYRLDVKNRINSRENNEKTNI